MQSGFRFSCFFNVFSGLIRIIIRFELYSCDYVTLSQHLGVLASILSETLCLLLLISCGKGDANGENGCIREDNQ